MSDPDNQSQCPNCDSTHVENYHHRLVPGYVSCACEDCRHQWLEVWRTTPHDDDEMEAE